MTPFYQATQVLFADDQRFDCRYFKTEADAKADAEANGGYVIETSPGLIWRNTIPR